MTVTERLLAGAPSAVRRPAAWTDVPIHLPMSRRDLPSLTRQLHFTTGAEIGVWKGEFSALLCEGNPQLELLCVDPWEPYQAWRDTKNALTGAEAEAFMAAAYDAAEARLAPLKARIHRAYSVDAAKTVPDGSLDFVYIDGNHGYTAVLDDLAAWTPKVRRGGFISGHDYRLNPTKPFIEVVRAVQDFVAIHTIRPWFVLANDRSPSFLWEVR